MDIELTSIELYQVNKYICFRMGISCDDAITYSVPGKDFKSGSFSDTIFHDCVLKTLDSVINNNSKLQRMLSGNPNRFEAKPHTVDARTVIVLNSDYGRHQLCYTGGNSGVRCKDWRYNTKNIPDLFKLIQDTRNKCN